MFASLTLCLSALVVSTLSTDPCSGGHCGPKCPYGDELCRGITGDSASYCKYWLAKPTCQGSEDPCTCDKPTTTTEAPTTTTEPTTCPPPCTKKEQDHFCKVRTHNRWARCLTDLPKPVCWGRWLPGQWFHSIPCDCDDICYLVDVELISAVKALVLTPVGYVELDVYRLEVEKVCAGESYTTQIYVVKFEASFYKVDYSTEVGAYQLKESYDLESELNLLQNAISPTD